MPVDDLAEAVQPGNAVVASVSLNLYVGYRCGRTHQMIWNELTVLGSAWTDPVNAPVTEPSTSAASSADALTFNKKWRVSEEPELQPPPQRGLILFNKKPSSALLHTLDSMSVDNALFDKGKGKEVMEAKTGAVSDSELSDYDLE